MIKNGSLPRLQFLSLSDCYITMNSDTMLIKALKAVAKRMRKLCIKTRRSSTVPSCVNLLQTHQLKKTLRERSRSPSHFRVCCERGMRGGMMPVSPRSIHNKQQQSIQ